MMAAELLRTVISLTLDVKRKPEYGHLRDKLISVRDEIDERIYPELERLFHADSAEFDKVIKLRTRRDQAQNPSDKAELIVQSSVALKPAIEIPLKFPN